MEGRREEGREEGGREEGGEGRKGAGCAVRVRTRGSVLFETA